MKTYIALLRGINVSGQKKIKMADLKAHLEELNFRNVRTYIQSGNVVFQHEPTDIELLQNEIEKKIQEKYGFEVTTLVKTPEELETVLTGNPFCNDPAKELSRIYITFLSDVPDPAQLEKLQTFDYSPEEYALDGKNLYFFSPTGYGKAKMNNNFFENKLKVQATTRNWATVTKLVEMAVNSQAD